jgi:hypothetical protein
MNRVINASDSQKVSMMKQKYYNLFFYGEIAKGHDVEEVKRKLSTCFNMDMNKIDRSSAGKPVVIKQNVDYKTALTCQLIFEWTGILCHIEPIMQASEQDSCKEQQYSNVNVIFDGTIDKRYSVEEVKGNLRGLLKLNERRLEELFTGRPVVIMRDVDYQLALKIQTSFALSGAFCRIEPVEQNPPDETVEHVPPRKIVQRSTYKTMTCPRCGFEQRKSRKCRRCGIYVDHYLKRNSTPKAKRTKQLAQKMDAAMRKELFNWGIGFIIWGIVLIIFGAIQFSELGLWAFCIVIVGILNLFVRQRALFIVNGITVCVSGALSLFLLTMNSFLTNREIGVNAGTGRFELITGMGFILLISIVQMYMGVQAFKKFEEYLAIKHIRHQ